MEIVKDSRLISLDTNYAKKLNGDFNSNLFFEMDTIVEENPKITHIEVSLEDATIPVSWYLINNDTRTLKYRYNLTDYTITLKKGNYTSTSLLNELSSLFLIQGLTATCTLDKQSGKSLFVFSNPSSDITFLHSGSEGLYRLLGFQVDNDYSGTTIESPTPMNLLGIQKLNLSSQILNNNEIIDNRSEIVFVNSFGNLPNYFKFANSVFIGKSLLEKFLKIFSISF